MANGLSLASTSNMATGQKILIPAANVAMEPDSPSVDLVLNDEMPQGHKQRDVLTYARIAQATALTEGVDDSQVEQIVSAALTVTPSEHGVIMTLSKRLVTRQADSNIVAAAGTLMGQSIAIRRDNDIVALYDTYTKSIIGASLPMDITHFRGACAYLLTDNSSSYGPAPKPFSAVLHIEQISDIIADLTDPGTVVSSRFGLSAEMLQRWWEGRDRLYGVEVFHDGNIARDSNGDAKGAIMNGKSSLVYVHAAGWSEAIVQEPDISLRATEYGIFDSWGEGLRADPHGVEVFSDAAATV